MSIDTNLPQRRQIVWRLEMAQYNAPKDVGGYGELVVYYPSQQYKCTVGKYCSVAQGAHALLEAEHRMDSVTTYPFSSFNPRLGLSPDVYCKGDIIVENDVWLGRDCCLMGGIKIGNGAVVGAHSVVTKDVEPYAIVGGNPARMIRKRFDDETIAALLRIAWWDWPSEKIMADIPSLCSTDIGAFIERHDPYTHKAGGIL